MGRIDSDSHWGCYGAPLKEVERVTEYSANKIPSVSLMLVPAVS